MRSKPKLSQVFLEDRRYIQKILAAIDVANKDILEIGPGKGQVTQYLQKKAKFLYCVELDSKFCNFLSNKFSAYGNIKIIHADILKFSISELDKKVVVFGNVPYQISSSLIEYLVRYRNFISKAYLTFQREFVQKLLARPSTGQYTFLSCYAQYYAKLAKIFDIPPSAFVPRPQVSSSFIELVFYKNIPDKAIDEKLLFDVIRQAFSQRRKKIVNSLKVPGDSKELFLSLGIAPDSRAENVSLDKYISIANKLYLYKNSKK